MTPRTRITSDKWWVTYWVYAHESKLERHLINVVTEWAEIETYKTLEKLEKFVLEEIEKYDKSNNKNHGKIVMEKKCEGKVMKNPPVEFYGLMFKRYNRFFMKVSEPIP